MRAEALLLLLLCGMVSERGRAADPAPIGAISYFVEACPDGWRPYQPAAGRAIVPTAPEGLGRTTGEPLAEGHEPRHRHEAYASFRLNGRSVFLETAASRSQVAFWQQGPIFSRGDAAESSSGLSAAKLNVCEKVEAPAGAAPAGIVFFFNDAACPNGWSPFQDANGRVLTGAAPEDAVGPFGNLRPLTDGEDRKHSHLISGAANLANYSFSIRAGCAGCDYAWATYSNYTYRGQAEESSSGLPYLQLPACSKDAPRGPQISRIVHGADFRERALAVGQHATLFGAAMGPLEGVGAALLENGEIDRLRGDVQVMVDETPAPLFFVRDDQINFQVPYEVAGRARVSVHVVRDGVAGPSHEVALADAAPALFTWGDNPERAIAVYADGSLNSADSPAEPGQPLILFATGEGLLSPPVRTGAPAQPPYSEPLGHVELWIGDEKAALDYEGAAPGFVGLMQINARMTSASGRAPVTLKIGGAETVAEALIFGR